MGEKSGGGGKVNREMTRRSEEKEREKKIDTYSTFVKKGVR